MKKVVLYLGALFLCAAVVFAQTPVAPQQTPPAPKQTPPAPKQTPAAPKQTPTAPIPPTRPGMPPQMTAPGGMGWGIGSVYNRMFNAATVETLKGVVVSVDSFSAMAANPAVMPAGPGMQPGIRLMLKTENDTISVHLGPAWFVENQESRILPRDSVEVTGSRITFNDKPAIIASDITKGRAVLRLRDEKGVPMWAAWRRK